MRAGEKTRVLIVQPRVLHYRVALFDRLAGYYDLVVAHSGSPTRRVSDIRYEERMVPRHGICGLHMQAGIGKYVRDSDVVIIPMDVHSISNTFCVLDRKRTTPVVLWGHGMGRSRLGNILRMEMARRAEALLLYCPEAIDAFVSKGYPRDRIFVTNNTLEVPNAGYNPAIQRRQLLFVGRLEKRKRIDKIIRAYAIVRRNRPNVDLVIVGGGAMGRDLAALAERLGIEASVRFLGEVVDHGKLKSIFQESLAYVTDRVGLGILHSFAYGVPVITNQNTRHAPEISNLANGINGMYYDGTIEDLARKMSVIADNPSLSYELGRNAHAHYSNHRTLEGMCTAFSHAIGCALGSLEGIRRGSTRSEHIGDQ